MTLKQLTNLNAELVLEESGEGGLLAGDGRRSWTQQEQISK